ncbi:MAG: tetratricopeptide repeat protein [Bacteroidaceae bacterium]
MMRVCFAMWIWMLVAWMPCLAVVQPDELRREVDEAVRRKAWAEVETRFQRWVERDAEAAARYYETVSRSVWPCRAAMARRLGDFYRQRRDYPRAFGFYNEWSTCEPQSVDGLLACAEMKVMGGCEEEALPYYERVLLLDAENRTANLFVGNYLFARAEAACRALKQAYEGLASPTKMDYARYREQLDALVQGDYARAKAHLIRVASQFRSQGIGQVLERIRAVEEESKQ